VRALLLIGLLAAPAAAEVRIGGAVGAGAQGASTYSALELRLEAAWEHAHVGLGARGVWDDTAFRTDEWTSPWNVLAIVRDVGVDGHAGDTQLAAAAGALAPAHVGTVVDGYRTTLDDRWRTGVRGIARSQRLELGAEIDDVLDPALIGGGIRWQMAPPWGLAASVAADPHHASVIEAGVFHRMDEERARLDTGLSIVAEPRDGASVVAYGSRAVESDSGVRFTARADVRAGNDSAGALFGPLYRVERLAWRERMGVGLGAGATVGVAAPQGWVELGARTRPDRPDLVVASAGAPMGRWVQAAAWAAAARGEAAGAAELRVAWSPRLFSALHAARLYRFDTMDSLATDAHAVWSVTAWFGATTR
jgi:hypothetical protein